MSEAATSEQTANPQQQNAPTNDTPKESAAIDSDTQPCPDPLSKIEPPGPECEDSPEPPATKRVPNSFAHRHYTTYHPCCNKLLAMKWDQTLRQQHLKKLSAAKATVDNSAPKPYMHLQVKLKKLQMEEDRLALVERNNRILLEKMSHIMKVEAKDPSIHGDRDYAHSLSTTPRGRQMTKIRDENKALLGRIESKQPHYDHNQWVDERTRNLAYLQNISSYPQRYIDLRKEIEKQGAKEKRRRAKGSYQTSEKINKLRAVFTSDGSGAKTSGMEGKGVDQSQSQQSDGRHLSAKTNKAGASGHASKTRTSHGAGKSSKAAGSTAAAAAKPRTPVADVDRVASERAIPHAEPLPDIAPSTGEPPIKTAVATK